jgi:hypothetical protein
MYADAGLSIPDYPVLPLPSLAERRRYFTNVNMDYVSKVPLKANEKVYPGYFRRCVDTKVALLDQFPDDNLCIVSHAMNVKVMVAALTKLSLKSLSEKIEYSPGSLGGVIAMASVTRVYRKRGTTKWKVDTQLANCTDHMTRVDLTSGGLPRGLPSAVLEQFAKLSEYKRQLAEDCPWEVVE